MSFVANEKRYESMIYNRCGRSGLKLPALSVGLWHNFGEESSFSNAKEIICGSFDLGITHFDLANNYGPPAGSAEETFGRIMKQELNNYRDEIVISTKAGYYMWPGPYGEWGSKKNLVASIDQSLKRLDLDYVDIFYHHRPDHETPLEETMDALAGIVRQGKALYIGLSNYSLEDTQKANKLLMEMGTRCLIHQPKYSMLNRNAEPLLDELKNLGIGSIVFSPLAQGLLTDKYINGIPENSRAAGKSRFLNKDNITPEMITKVKALNDIANKRGQSLAQMALAWILGRGSTTSIILGASRLEQIKENSVALQNISFSDQEMQEIDRCLSSN